VRLRQSYVRIANRAAMMAGRYAHADSSTATVDSCAFCALASAGSFATSGATLAGNAELEAVFVWPLSRADQIRLQQQRPSAAASCVPSTNSV
jgi:IS5 family transposase